MEFRNRSTFGARSVAIQSGRGTAMKHALGDRELNRSGDHTGDLFGWYGEGSCRVKRDWAVAGGCKVLWYILKMFS